MRILLHVVGEAVMPLVNDLPRREAREDDDPAHLADEAVDRPREVVVGAVVDEHAAEDLRVNRQRQKEPEANIPVLNEGLVMAKVHGREGHDAEGGVEAVIPEVEVPIAPELREREGRQRRNKGGHDGPPGGGRRAFPPRSGLSENAARTALSAGSPRSNVSHSTHDHREIAYTAVRPTERARAGTFYTKSSVANLHHPRA